MNKMKMILYMIGTVLLLATLTGCTSGGYYGGSSSYYHRNSWDYDRYYRSGVNRHYHGTNVNVHRSTNSVNRSRSVHRSRSGGGRRR
jgi:hypothetical protein